MTAVADRPRHRCRQLQFFALGILLLTVAIRLPALCHPLAIDDEETYSLVANELVDGGRLYIDAVERKPPLLFWTYAAVFKIAGKYNWHALHAVALIWTLATMAGLYVIGKGLSDPFTGLIAALLYSIFQPWGTFLNLAFNGEVLMNLPLVWAWAIAFRQSRSRVRLELLVAGALLCAAFLLKQPAAIAAVPIGIYLLLPSYSASRGLTRLDSFVHAALLTVGFFGTLDLAVAVLWKQGILAEAFYWTFTNHSIPHLFWQKGVLFTLAFIGACLPLILGAVIGYFQKDVWDGKRAERVTLLGLVGASALGAAAGARFYPHYYIQLVPPLVLLAAVHYGQIWSGKVQRLYWWQRPAVTWAWLGLTILGFSIAHWQGLAGHRKLSETGRYLLEHSDPNDRIFVWGQTPKIYLDAQRRPASRFVITFPLTGYIFGGLPGVDTRAWIVQGAWDKLEQDFAKHPPVYIVDVQVPEKNAQYPTRNFPILARILAEQYQPVARTAEGVIYRVR
ncbi:MAG: hypothetical protein QOG67_1817 [Verrucomicrobiota bacterium]|jgi:4-amino-4-deoxy-L-arabinose transferase-like glycosyltransferase